MDGLPQVTHNGTHGTDGTDNRGTLTADRIDTLLDAMATANRIGRANAATLWRIENAVVFLGFAALTFYVARKGK